MLSFHSRLGDRILLSCRDILGRTAHCLRRVRALAIDLGTVREHVCHWRWKGLHGAARANIDAVAMGVSHAVLLPYSSPLSHAEREEKCL